MKPLSISIFQSALRDESVVARLSWLDMAAERAARNGARLLVCPELSLSGPQGHMRPVDLARPRGGEYDERIAEIAYLHGIWLALGYPEAVGRRVYNTAVLVSPAGEVVGRHRKNHLTDPAGSSPMAAGTGVMVLELEGWKVAMLVGHDILFPDLAAQATRNGAEILVLLAAATRDESFLPRILAPARAIENGAHVVCANWAAPPEAEGLAGALCGMSRIIGPDGMVLARAGNEETILSACLGRQEVTRARTCLASIRDYREKIG